MAYRAQIKELYSYIEESLVRADREAPTSLPSLLVESASVNDVVLEEMERVLAQVDGMTNDAFAHLFTLLIGHVSKSLEGSHSSNIQKSSELLAILCQKDRTQYESLIDPWLHQVINSSSRPTLVVALNEMISSGAVDISNVVTVANDNLKKANDDVGSIEAADLAELAFQTINVFLDDEESRPSMNEDVSHLAFFLMLSFAK